MVRSDWLNLRLDMYWQDLFKHIQNMQNLILDRRLDLKVEGFI